MNILVYPDERLLQPSLEVPEGDFQALIDSYFPAVRDTLLKTQTGLALAAPQVGIHQRFFVVRLNERTLEIVVNPTYVPENEEKVLFDEGCLSFPGVFEEVKRYPSIKASYTALDAFSFARSEVKDKHLDGLMAQVFQHETDHLDGKLMVDYVDERNQKRIANKLKKWKMKGYRWP